MCGLGPGNDMDKRKEERKETEGAKGEGGKAMRGGGGVKSENVKTLD